MKPSEVFGNAAKLVEDRACDGSCLAMATALGQAEKWWSAFGGPRWKAPHDVCAYLALMKPTERERHSDAYWWPSGADGGRIVGLCLLAAIAKSERQ